MSLYCKKPVIIEAEAYRPGMEDGFAPNDECLRSFGADLDGCSRQELEGCKGCKCYKPYISTLEGKMFIDRGDYIITGVKGERYPCKPDIFALTYVSVGAGLTFGQALELLKQGKKLTRPGWNGRGMFVVYQKGYPDGIPCNKQTAEAWGMNEGDLFICNPYLQIKNVNGSHSMWVPSINDVLAEDWQVVE